MGARQCNRQRSSIVWSVTSGAIDSSPHPHMGSSFLTRWCISSFFLLGLILTGVTPAASAAEKPNYETILQNLKWRELGPAITGGRVDDIAVVENDPNIVYVGIASGGVWRTTNGGTTWEPIFDNEGVSTIGAVTVAPSDPSIIWVGTGEPNNRQSSSWGNGVYKSTDGGKSWTNIGLKDSHHIGRIVIHPTNPDVVYVAALGHLWGPNKERGLFKTTDGGKTWINVLFIDEDTGVVDLVMDPHSPDTLYAAAYERRRTVFGFNGGGPRSGLYKTTDGGTTWKKLTKGLPGDGDVGRIGLAIYRKNPSIVYALIEHAKGGVFRSEDKGEAWTKMSDTDPRPSYYSQIHIDPNNDLRIWVLGALLSHSQDGGKTFYTDRNDPVRRIHGDYHAMWINPANSDQMIVGSDGGVNWSYDRGHTWEFVSTLAIGQFYEVAFDMAKPYHICGGMQDNGVWCGPSATPYVQGISNEDWFRVDTGDGFYALVDPADPNIVYAESQDGNVIRRDLRTNESRDIRPQPKKDEPPYRFQWNSPILISAHDPKTIYYGGNFLFRSTDRGDTWTRLSGDLTTGVDRTKMLILGQLPRKDTLSRNDGVEWYPCITTISESPLNGNVLWVGTDDGTLQVTRDGGQTWRNVAERVAGVPKGTYVSRVMASRLDAGTAYVAFDGHRSDDFNVYVLRTADYGESWSSLSRGIPANGGTVHVVREHPRNPNLLFVGTEYGAYVSFDRGANWTRLKMNLPTVPVDDIAVHPRENDLIFGTHGRSIWVLDDITPLEQLDEKVLSAELHLFDIRAAIAWRMYVHRASPGNKMFLASNPPAGALLTYYLKSKVDDKERVRITILDKDGKVVRELEGGKDAGLNRVNWDLRYASPAERTLEQREALARGFFAGAPRDPMVEPGEYTVKITVGKDEASKPVRVEEDPRISVSDTERAARRQAIMQLFELYKTADQGRKTITGLKTALTAAIESWKKPGAPKIPENVQRAAHTLSRQVEELHGKFVAPPDETHPLLVYRPAPLPQRVGRLMFVIEGYTAAPTPQQAEELVALSMLLRETMDKMKKIVDEGLANLNKMMNEAGIPHISIAPAPGRGADPEDLKPGSVGAGTGMPGPGTIAATPN